MTSLHTLNDPDAIFSVRQVLPPDGKNIARTYDLNLVNLPFDLLLHR
jgi:hypothetical protein